MSEIPIHIRARASQLRVKGNVVMRPFVRHPSDEKSTSTDLH